MQFDIFTLLPEVIHPYIQASILKRAQEAGLISIGVHNIRDFTTDRHHICDDTPYGGGGGMVMKPEPVFTAIESVLGTPPACPVIYLSPQGRTFTQQIASELATYPRLAFLCGRYEAVDERVIHGLVSQQLSIGDYVLTGGELPALVVIDAIARLLPGVLGDPDGAQDDSFASGLLEYPHYTRPPVFREMPVPEVLLSGDHARIARWRREQALLRTWQRRPELLESAELTPADRKFLDKLRKEEEPGQTPDPE